jgi:hypothetical protein
MTSKKLYLSSENSNFFHKLKQIDLCAIAQKLMHPEEGKGWTKQQTTRGLTHYLMFLFLLYLHPDQNLIPTKEIDQVWHNHILLNVNQYIQDCEMLFGRLINHVYSVKTEDNFNNWQENIAQTQELFQQYFEVEIFTEAKQHKPAGCEPLHLLL